MAPSTSETITAGVVIVLSAPPIMIGAPGILLTIMIPTAPAACAANAFITKLQVPLFMSAIFPLILLAGAPVHAS